MPDQRDSDDVLERIEWQLDRIRAYTAVVALFVAAPAVLGAIWLLFVVANG